MEAVEAFLDGEWESLTKLFSCEEDTDIQLNFNGGNFFPNDGEIPSSDGTFLLPSDNLNPSFYCLSQESSNGGGELEGAPFTSTAAVNGCNFVQDLVTDHTTFQSMDVFTTNSKNDDLMVPDFSDNLMEEILQLKAQMEIQPTENSDSCKEMQLKRKYEAPSNVHEDNCPDQNPRKRPRVSRDVQRNKGNVQLRKNKKASTSDEEENNVGGNGQNSSTCSSEEDDVNGASKEMNEGSASSGKAKATKSPATDPQSLYARKRRERINERLRILQNLVPNGTKVDISTMLEEAVHYVKFLQLQIKLLSSDDMWMYAPIAYNGMDIGLYQKIGPNI